MLQICNFFHLVGIFICVYSSFDSKLLPRFNSESQSTHFNYISAYYKIFSNISLLLLHKGANEKSSCNKSTKFCHIQLHKTKKFSSPHIAGCKIIGTIQ